MNDQLNLGTDSTMADSIMSPDRFRLACGHITRGDHATHPRRVDGWYVAVRCPECRRAVGVTVVAFARLETPAETR